MAGGTITYEYGPSDEVWVIYSQTSTQRASMNSRAGCAPNIDGDGIKQGSVVYYKATVLKTETTEVYGINIAGTSTTRDFNVADVFGSLSEALVEYESRLSGAAASP